jgi:excinuclease UvrABC ATPase subunit
MTELNDHLKLLFARAAKLHCRGCGKPVAKDSPQSIYESLRPQYATLAVEERGAGALSGCTSQAHV